MTHNNNKKAPSDRAPKGAFLISRLMPYLAACALALASLSSAHAASLQVSPVRMELTTQENSKPLWVSNTGKENIHVQVRVYKWTQENGEDVLTPTNEVIATPAMTEVAPGARQIIRIVRQAGASPDEQAYRLRVEELPQPRKVLPPGEKPALNLLLAYSLPVFLATGDTSAPQSTDLVATTSGGQLVLRNTGKKRVMISDLRALDQAGQETMIQQGLVGYVLSGQTRTFPMQAPSQAVKVRATINQSHAADWDFAR